MVDEAYVYMNGTVCSNNFRMYAERGDPPRDFVYDTSKDRRKVTVFAGMVGNNTLIGPVSIDDNMNSEQYLQVLNQDIAPALEQSFGRQRNGAIRRVCWGFSGWGYLSQDCGSSQ